MRVLQCAAADLEAGIQKAKSDRFTGLAIELGAPEHAYETIARAGLETWAWHRAAYDPAAAAEHPEWMHAPQHPEWLRRFPSYEGGHPALVAPYIGLSTQAAADHALARLMALPRRPRVLLFDVQGPPMGCGCGNPCCRSWDNAPGPKVAPSAYEGAEILFTMRFLRRVRASAPDVTWLPVLCPECERGITLDGVEDPDGPNGTDLCQGVACVSPCATVYWPRLLETAHAEGPVGLLLTVRGLEKDHPVYGPSGSWASRAHRHYGEDHLPFVEPPEADRFERVVVVTDLPEPVQPVAPPNGYVPSVPPIRCHH